MCFHLAGKGHWINKPCAILISPSACLVLRKSLNCAVHNLAIEGIFVLFMRWDAFQVQHPAIKKLWMNGHVNTSEDNWWLESCGWWPVAMSLYGHTDNCGSSWDKPPNSKHYVHCLLKHIIIWRARKRENLYLKHNRIWMDKNSLYWSKRTISHTTKCHHDLTCQAIIVLWKWIFWRHANATISHKYQLKYDRYRVISTNQQSNLPSKWIPDGNLKR